MKNKHIIAAVLICFIGAIGVSFWFYSRQKANGNSVSDNNRKEVVAMQKVIGRWKRSDGSYYLDVKEFKADNTLDAAYYNPSPINIGETRYGYVEKLSLFIKLDDQGYPGSTYTLEYDPERDLLLGDYHQATSKQTYNIFFTRVQK